MSAPNNVPLPTVIQGPAYVTHGGVTLYTKGDVAVEYTTETWQPESAFGKLGKRFKSRRFKISFTPVGMLTNTIISYFYGAYTGAPAGYPSSVGNSVITGPLVVVSIPQKKSYTYEKCGLAKPPPLQLGPSLQPFGQVSYIGIGNAASQPTSTTFFKADDTSVVTLDTSFDQSKIVSDIYSLSYNIGTVGAPFTAMGTVDGLKLEFDTEIKEVPMGDIGVGDVILTSIGVSATFRPSNLTEAQVDTLVSLQGAATILPGMPIAYPVYGATAVPLVATGTQGGMIVTVPVIGVESTGLTYQVGEHRLKEVKMYSDRVWGTGAETALISFSGTY